MRVMRFLQSMFCLPFVPRSIGATQCEGGRSQGKRDKFFGGLLARLFVVFSKGGAGNLAGKPKPVRARTAKQSCRARELPGSQARWRGAERETKLQRRHLRTFLCAMLRVLACHESGLSSGAEAEKWKAVNTPSALGERDQ